MVLEDPSKICFGKYFYVVSCLLYINTIKTFYDAQIVEMVRHLRLYLRFYIQGGGKKIGTDNEVVNLLEY